jgi:hypothetical protein
VYLAVEKGFAKLAFIARVDMQAAVADKLKIAGDVDRRKHCLLLMSH